MSKNEKKFEDYFKIIKHKLPYWDELPEIDLYMDQVVALMEKYMSFHKTDENSKIITNSMINNYVKLGIMPAPIKKRYSREHIAYLIIICSLKQALPIADIKNLIETRFFRTNKITEEKINIFKEKLGVDMSYLLPYKFEGEKSKDVQIFSLCYSKKDFQFLDDEVITPLQVGAANGTNVCELKDNTGDNISGANYFYIENT